MPNLKTTETDKISILFKLLQEGLELKKKKKWVKKTKVILAHLKLKTRDDMASKGKRLINRIMELSEKKKKKMPKQTTTVVKDEEEEEEEEVVVMEKKPKKVVVKEEPKEMVVLPPMKTYKEKKGMLTPEALLEIERDFKMLREQGVFDASDVEEVNMEEEEEEEEEEDEGEDYNNSDDESD